MMKSTTPASHHQRSVSVGSGRGIKFSVFYILRRRAAAPAGARPGPSYASPRMRPSVAMALPFMKHCLLQRAPAVPRTARRRLHLAPPFLLDDYTPRYLKLSSRDAAKKRSLAYAHQRNSNLCPRQSRVNRYETTGMCLIGDTAKVNVIAPHFGEG